MNENTHQEQSDGRADERRLLKDSVTSFVGRTGGPSRARALRDRSSGVDRAMWVEMAELGWLAVTVPSQYDGLGLSFSEMAVIAEELGGAIAPEPITEAITLAGGVLCHAGGTVAADLLPKVVSGMVIPALAWQELNGSYDPESVSTTAQAGTNGVVRLNGVKAFVPHADTADGYIVTAKCDESLALFWIPSDTNGLEISMQLLADGSKCGRITFTQVEVNAEQKIAVGLDAVSALTLAIDEAVVMASVSLVGLMSKALDMTIEYLKMRVQFGKPIGSFQSLQHRAVDMYIQRELSKATVTDAIRLLADDTDAFARSSAASRAKARCSAAALHICREAVQLHGAIGYTDEYDLGLYLNRALTLSAWLGNSAYHRHRYSIIENKSSCGVAP